MGDTAVSTVVASDDLLLLILENLSALALVRVATTQRRWRALLCEAARRRALLRGEAVKQLVTAVPIITGLPKAGWLRALTCVEALEASVGVRPDRCWRAEWETSSGPDSTSDAEGIIAAPADDLASQIKSSILSQPGAIERNVCKFAWALELRELAWPREHAQALALLYTWGNQAISRSVRQRSPLLTASTWIVCEALAQAYARQMGASRPHLVYANLHGRGGLIADDPRWKALLAPHVARGTSFSTSAIAMTASEMTRRGVVWSGQPTAAAGAGVACFKPRLAAFGSRRSLVDVGSGRFALPPFACVTVHAVEEAGEWRLGKDEGEGSRTLCRRYTVFVDW